MTDTATNPNVLPPQLPIPQDDGGARHLTGMALPDLALPATAGAPVNLAALKGRTVVYIYPRTGVPGIPKADLSGPLLPAVQQAVCHVWEGTCCCMCICMAVVAW